MKKLEINKGDKYGRYSIIKEIEKVGYDRRFLCECDCGNVGEAILRNLRKGNTRSCGCLHKEMAGVRKNVKHGGVGTGAYASYQSMKQRCYNPKSPNYKRYGGRGIKVCSNWLKGFENFIKDMGDRPKSKSLDRIDNDGNYEPENCRWATSKEQQNNTSKTPYIKYKGVKYSVMEASDKFNIKYVSLVARLKKGWSVRKSIETPVDFLVRANITCSTCNKEFHPSKSTSKFCSKKCIRNNTIFNPKNK